MECQSCLGTEHDYYLVRRYKFRAPVTLGLAFLRVTDVMPESQAPVFSTVKSYCLQLQSFTQSKRMMYSQIG
jgi:hypothetical protein